MSRLLEFIVNFIVNKIILWPFYLPIIFLLKEVKCTPLVKNNGITILAINPDRFRDGELESLARSGFSVLLMPYQWQTRVFYAYKDRSSKEQFKNPPENSSIYIDRIRLRRYLSYLLKAIYLKKNINCVIGAGLFYNQDFDWGAVSTSIGTPYIVLHRENLVLTKHIHEAAVYRAKSLRDTGFFGTSIVFHNKIMKNIYDKYSGISTNDIYALGSLRMDKYLNDIKGKKNKINNNCITLFSFNVTNSLRGYMGIENDFGWHKLHNDVHTSFVDLAIKNPKINFIIKHKGVKWSETESLLKSINALNLVNLKICGESFNAQELILKSDVVTGFCSTTLLEASVAGKPVIYPLFGEAQDESYKDFLCFENELDMFDVATSKDEYKDLLIKKMKQPKVSQEKMKLRRLNFDKYVSLLDSSAVKKHTELIINEVKKISIS